MNGLSGWSNKINNTICGAVNMKEYSRVRLIIKNEKYAQDGVHKGMG